MAYVPAELLRLAVGVQCPGELPVGGQGQFDRGSIRAGRRPVAHEARRRRPACAGAAGGAGNGLLGSIRCGKDRITAGSAAGRRDGGKAIEQL